LVATNPKLGGSVQDLKVLQLTFDRSVTVEPTLIEVYGSDTGARKDFAVEYADDGKTVLLKWPEPLAPDVYTVILRSLGVWAGSGEARIDLDGEVADPADPESLPSGNGTPGGDAELGFEVP
jgi:hypothetical protein